MGLDPPGSVDLQTRSQVVTTAWGGAPRAGRMAADQSAGEQDRIAPGCRWHWSGGHDRGSTVPSRATGPTGAQIFQAFQSRFASRARTWRALEAQCQFEPCRWLGENARW